MTKAPSLDELWNWAKSSGRSFRAEDLSSLSDATRVHLEHSMAARAGLASAVRLHMHGEIKRRQWLAFRAEQVICWNRDMI
jgi:hypothetical protein